MVDFNALMPWLTVSIPVIVAGVVLVGTMYGHWKNKQTTPQDDIKALWEENRRLREEISQERNETRARLDQLEKQIAEVTYEKALWKIHATSLENQLIRHDIEPLARPAGL